MGTLSKLNIVAFGGGKFVYWYCRWAGYLAHSLQGSCRRGW